MAERDLEEKFDELFELFSRVVVEKGDHWETLLFARYEVRKVAFRVAGRKFVLAADRVRTPAYTSEPGIQAKAGLFGEDDRKVAEFQLHAKEWAWKLVRDSDSLALADVGAETIREVMQAALESAHE
jgi:hypothetical protein